MVTFCTPQKDYCTTVNYLVWLAGIVPTLSWVKKRSYNLSFDILVHVFQHACVFAEECLVVRQKALPTHHGRSYRHTKSMVKSHFSFWKDRPRLSFRTDSGNSTKATSVNTNHVATHMPRFTSPETPPRFSAARGWVTTQKDHLTILLGSSGDKKQLGSRKDTVWFACTNKCHKLFTGLQSLEIGKVHQGKSRICLFAINYLCSMFYNIRCVEKA